MNMPEADCPGIKASMTGAAFAGAPETVPLIVDVAGERCTTTPEIEVALVASTNVVAVELY